MKYFIFFLSIICLGCSIPNDPQMLSQETGAEDIVFFNDFERPSVGLYTLRSFNEDWNGSRWELGVVDERVYVVMGQEAFQGQSLRVHYPKGQTSFGKSGASWYVPLGQTYGDIYCAYRIKFVSDFDFANGGKLPGFMGGEGNTSGRKPTGSDGWSARMIWLADGVVAQNIYHPDQKDDYGDVFVWQGQQHFRTDVWHWVEHRVVMNTPGNNDGFMEAWLDGTLALQVSNLRFRDVDSLGIDTFYFTTFFGDDRPSVGPVKDEVIYFDNLMIATAPITH